MISPTLKNVSSVQQVNFEVIPEFNNKKITSDRVVFDEVCRHKCSVSVSRQGLQKRRTTTNASERIQKEKAAGKVSTLHTASCNFLSAGPLHTLQRLQNAHLLQCKIVRK